MYMSNKCILFYISWNKWEFLWKVEWKIFWQSIFWTVSHAVILPEGWYRICCTSH